MDILVLIQSVLFVPFILVLIMFGAIYLINGYKKDLGNSLVSLLATIISTTLSFLLAKGCGWLLSKPAVSVLSVQLSEILAELGPLSTLGSSIIQGALEVALSFFFFGLFFFISLAVFKALGKKISWDKLEKLNTGKTGTRLAGMGLRAIDAIIVTIMLLLPLYGTIAMVAPPVATIASISENLSSSSQQQNIEYNMELEETEESEAVNEGAEIVEILESVANHPVLLAYKIGPGDWVYSGLSSFSMNGNTIDVAAAADSLAGLLERIQVCVAAVEKQDAQAVADATQDLIDFARDEVIYQEWSYEMIMAMVGEIDKIVEEFAKESPEGEILLDAYEQIRPLLNMSFEEYTYNAEGLLDFLGWAVGEFGKYSNNDVPEEEMQQFELEFYSRAGELLNYSEQAIGLKKIILQIAAQTMFDALPNPNNPEYADYYEARKDLPNSGAEFVEKYFGDGIVPEEQRSAEAAAFFMLINGNDALTMAEIFARHPLFGADAVLEAMDEYLYINGCYGSFGHQLAESKKAQKAYKKLDQMLKNCETKDIGESFDFDSDVYGYLSEDLGIDGYYYVNDEYGYGYDEGNANVNVVVPAMLRVQMVKHIISPMITVL